MYITTYNWATSLMQITVSYARAMQSVTHFNIMQITTLLCDMQNMVQYADHCALCK